MAPPLIDLDVVLEEIGSYGRFQAEVLIYMALPLLIKAMYNTQYVFAAGVTEYRCRVPQCESTPEKFEPGAWQTFALPDEAQRKCNRYVATGSSCEAASFTGKLEKCWSWVFENHNTIVYDFDLACQELKRTLVGTTHSFAGFAALPALAYCSDAWGRGLVLVACAVLPAIFGVWRAFVNNYYVYIVLEYVESFVGCGTYSTAFVLGVEMVTINNRVIAGNFVGGLYSLGQSFLGVFGHFFRYWRTFTLVIYTPSFGFIFYFWIYKESLRWLITSGRQKEAARVLLRAAKLNKRQLTSKTMATLQAASNMEEKRVKKESKSDSGRKKPSTWKKVIKSKTILYRLLVCSYAWISMQIVAYGLSINSVSLAGSRYLNFTISSLIEIPGKILSALVLDRFGRKSSICCAEFICGASLIASGFISSDLITIILTMFGKLLISMITVSTYIYTVELFPTEARHTLLSVCCMLGRIGSMLAPQTSLLMQSNKKLTNQLFGVLIAIAGVLLLLLPETLNMKLPDTVEEIDNPKMVVKKPEAGSASTDKK